MSISAGGSFCIALDDKKRLWSWGMYASGRLGSQPPKIRDPRIRKATSSPGEARVATSTEAVERVASYRDKITYHEGRIADRIFTNVGLGHGGEAHALAIDDHGRLYARLERPRPARPGRGEKWRHAGRVFTDAGQSLLHYP